MQEVTDLPYLGNPTVGIAVAQRAARSVPAYASVLRGRRTPDEPTAWGTLPLVDKKSYLLAHPFVELMADDARDTFGIFSSSGSSGQPFYWPQLKSGQGEVAAHLAAYLEDAFRIHERRTLAIVGLALGSWIGGEHISWMLKNVACSSRYPFAVFVPGNHHDEIVAMIEKVDQLAEQIILFCCPSAIGHLRLRARQRGRDLPLDRMRFVVIGEPFPETVRLELQAESGVSESEPVMLSVFGSADTGVLGKESRDSALVRGLCEKDAGLASKLGFGAVVPHLFHHADPGSFLEAAEGELCITKWQGIPLVRYNLHDAVRFLAWRDICRVVRRQAPASAAASALEARAQELPDVLAITGRADSCLLLCGTNLTEAMLDNAVRAAELTPWLTGSYTAQVVLEDGRQRLRFALECKDGVPPSAATAAAVYPLLIASLGRVQPEFKDDWQSIYRAWDDDPRLRILDLQLAAWPALSGDEAGRIKHRGVRP